MSMYVCTSVSQVYLSGLKESAPKFRTISTMLSFCTPFGVSLAGTVPYFLLQTFLIGEESRCFKLIPIP